MLPPFQALVGLAAANYRARGGTLSASCHAEGCNAAYHVSDVSRAARNPVDGCVEQHCFERCSKCTGNAEQGDRRQADAVRDGARTPFRGFAAATLPSFAAA